MHKHTNSVFQKLNITKSEYHKKYNTNTIYKKYCSKQITKNRFKFLQYSNKLFKTNNLVGNSMNNNKYRNEVHIENLLKTKMHTRDFKKKK